MRFPVVINNRNRLTMLRVLLSWLEGLPVRVIILDNGSTYPPLLDFYQCYRSADIVYLGQNYGHTALYSWGEHLHFPERYFVYTDPDVVPSPKCPRDAIDYLVAAKKKHAQTNKVGMAIEINDLPDHYEFKADVIDHESQFWKAKQDEFYVADVDSTFAVYDNTNSFEHCIGNCLRSDYPYVVRHLPWYLDNGNLDEEERYYLLHANAEWFGTGRTLSGRVGKWTQKVRQKRLIKLE